MKDASEWKTEFIEVSTIKHKGYYDYSLVDYKTARIKVKILCPEHGVFEQTPDSHKSGSGCKKCAGLAKPTTEEFVSKMKLIHSNKYTYEGTVYGDNAHSKVTVTCPIHGEFEITPANHKKGKGCKKCGVIAGHAKQMLSIKNYVDSYKLDRVKTQELLSEQFVEKGRNKYGGTFEYAKVKYVNMLTNVIITCKVHGDFETLPNTHLSEQSLGGCRKCGRLSGAKKKSLGVADKYLKSFVEVHGSKYDYSSFEYITAKTKSKVICPDHGEFFISPDNHARGKGCQKCAKYGFDIRKSATFYIYISSNDNFVGYGITSNLRQRNVCHLKNFKKSGIAASLFATFKGDGKTIQELERCVKQTFKDKQNGSNIEGFIHESTKYDNLPMLLKTTTEFISTRGENVIGL